MQASFAIIVLTASQSSKESKKILKELEMSEYYNSAYNFASGGGFNADFKVAAGFDGFLDSIAKPIRFSAQGAEEYFPTISSFGEYIASKASLSCSIELKRQTVKVGGNMPIYVSALSAFGCRSNCIGAFGYPNIHDMFLSLGDNIAVTSVSDAGVCSALEFNDGKVMLADNGGTNLIDYALLLEIVGKNGLVDWLDNADALALLNWSELPGMTSVWNGLLKEVLPSTNFGSKKLLLIDVSDCSKRSADDIRAMAEMTKQFSSYFTVVFSLNQNECTAICSALGLDGASTLSGALASHILVLHVLDGAFIYSAGIDEFVPTEKVEKPMTLTGGGDNFNAGLTLALLAGMSPCEATAVGNAASNFYVLNGRSASMHELLSNIKRIGGYYEKS